MSESEQTPFANRLAAVWLTWRTRPLVWLLSLAYAVAVVVVIVMVRSSNRPFDFDQAAAKPNDPHAVQTARIQWENDRWRAATPRMTKASPQINVGLPDHATSGRQPPDPAKVRTIQIFLDPGADAALWQPGHYPQVDAIASHAELTNDQLRKLLELYEVRSLTLNNCMKFDSETLTILTSEQTLEQLHLGVSPLLKETQPLVWPPKLRSLTVWSFLPLPLQRFTEWRTLPRLHTLQLHTPYWTTAPQIPEAVISELSQFPALTTLYLDEMYSSDHPDRERGTWAAIVQPQLPQIAVRPTLVPKSRGFSGIIAFVLMLLGTSLGAIQLSGFGVTPFSRLAPQTALPHAVVTAGWWVCVALISAGVMVWQGAAWPAALAMAGSGPAIYGLLLKLFSRMPAGQAAYANIGLALLPAIFAVNLPIFSMFLFEFAPPTAGGLDWFLRGQWPVLSAVWLTVDILAAWWLLDRLTGLVRHTEAVGLHAVPLSALDIAGWNRAVAPLTKQQYERLSTWHPIFRGRDSRLEALLAQGPIRTRADRLNLWHAGAFLQARDIGLIALLMGCFQSLVFVGARYADGLENVFLPVAAMVTMQLAVMLLGLPFIVFWQRRKYLACELLRPVSREHWTADWWQMQATAFLPALVFGMAAIVLMPWSIPARGAESPEILLAGLLFVAFLALLWSCNLWTATYSTLKAGLIALAAVAVTLIAIFGLAALADAHMLPELSPTLILSLLLTGSLIAACIVTALAYRRWQAWELGRLDS